MSNTVDSTTHRKHQNQEDGIQRRMKILHDVNRFSQVLDALKRPPNAHVAQPLRKRKATVEHDHGSSNHGSVTQAIPCIPQIPANPCTPQIPANPCALWSCSIDSKSMQSKTRNLPGYPNTNLEGSRPEFKIPTSVTEVEQKLLPCAEKSEATTAQDTTEGIVIFY